MTRIDAYLSRRVQRLDPSARVLETDAGWILDRPGTEPLGLGETFGEARQAVDAWCRSETARRGAA